VKQAEEEARKKVLEEYPDVDAEVFKIKVSHKVKEDEERRKRVAAKALPPFLPPRGAAPVHIPLAVGARRIGLEHLERLQHG
jgi:hypothetical protein